MPQPVLDQKGMVLVFTVILLAVFLSTALGFSYFILGDINKARAIDNSVIAYYAADAGMEESLYLLKKQSIADSLVGLLAIRSAGGSLSESKGTWSIGDSTIFEKTVLRQRLYNGQSAKFFILNRSTGANQTKSITVEWYKGGLLTPNLQISLTQLTPQDQNGTLVYYTDTSVVEIGDSEVNGLQCFDLKDIDLNGQPLTSPTDYFLEFKVLGSTDDFVDRLLVKAYNRKCGEQDFNQSLNEQGITNLTLKSKGIYGQAMQTIFAYLLPKDPLSGLFSFVLFSEENVIKE